MARSERRSERMRSIEAISVRESQDLAGRMERQARVVREAEQKLQELSDYLQGYAAEQRTVVRVPDRRRVELPPVDTRVVRLCCCRLSKTRRRRLVGRATPRERDSEPEDSGEA